MPHAHSLTENLYEKLTNEEDARVCKAIDESACREVPGNFILTLISYFFSKLGDAVANAKIVLPWIMESLAAPVYLIGFLVPIRESGSLIPQLFIASYVRAMPIRKWMWILGSVLQAVCLFGIAIVALTLEGEEAGWSIIGLLIGFSLSRGLSSVAAKDVVGKTIPKSRRGQLNGWSASAAGLITLGIAGVMMLDHADQLSTTSSAILLIFAGVLWCIAALTYTRIKEFPGETDGGGNAISDAIKRLHILRDDKPFRLFVITRSLLLCSALTAPYYVVMAQKHLGSAPFLLGLFVFASGAASLVSAPVWGKMADVSSRNVMIMAAIITSLLGVIVFLIKLFFPNWLDAFWLLPLVYFCLSIAHQGVRIGRKTYVIDLAEGNRRTDYVSVSNSVIGVILLLMGGVGLIGEAFDVSMVILLLSMLGLIGAVLATRLPDVE